VLLAFVAFISLGLPDAILGVAWPSIRHAFDRALDNLGILLFAGTLAYMISSFCAGAMLRVMSVGTLLAASCACVTVALTGYALAPSFWWLVPVAFVGGLGAGAIDSGLNLFAASHFSTRVMNWLHACWGIGATTGPLVMTTVLGVGASYRVGYGIVAALLASLTLLFIITRRLWSDDHAAKTEHATVSAGVALKQPLVWQHMLIYFVYGGVETTAGQLLFTLFTEARGLSVAAAGTTVGGYWAALTIGRIVFGQFAVKATPRKLLLIGTIGAPLAAMLIALQGPVAIVGALALGFSLAPIFPTYMTITPQRLGPAIAPHAVGFQVAACAIGMMILPGSVAAVSQRAGLEAISVFLIASTTVMLVLHLIAQRQRGLEG